MALAVIEKLRHRIANLRAIVLNLIHVGYFENIRTQVGNSLSITHSSTPHEHRAGARR
jgi:hypothetical protein